MGRSTRGSRHNENRGEFSTIRDPFSALTHPPPHQRAFKENVGAARSTNQRAIFSGALKGSLMVDDFNSQRSQISKAGALVRFL